MTEALVAIAAMAAVGFIIWLVMKSSTGGTGEGLVAELRLQSTRKDEEIASLRAELATEREAKVAAETRHSETQKNLEAQLKLLDSMEAKLAETFKALSLDALSKNAEEFRKQAEQAFRDHTALGKKELEGKKALIDKSIEAVTKSISEVQRKVEEVGRGSGERMKELMGHIKSHAETTQQLSDTANGLLQTLGSAKKRGEWGERMAEDIISMVGLIEGVNYIKQKSLEGSSGRPDFTFMLPNGLKINMDVKFPLDNYQRFVEAKTDPERKAARDELLRNVRTMIKDLASNREYINPADNTVDYVIIFIPNEQVYGFVNETDTSLIDDALRQKVILCSPFTLYAVLAVIRQSVENFNLERTTSEILKHIAEFHKQWEKYKQQFKSMGEKIDAARKEYDALLTTRSNVLERPLRKIEDLRRQKAIPMDADADADADADDKADEGQSLLP